MSRCEGEVGKEVLLFLGKRRRSGRLRRKREGKESGKKLEEEVSRCDGEVGKEVAAYWHVISHALLHGLALTRFAATSKGIRTRRNLCSST